MSIVKEFPYPWAKRPAQDLHMTLVRTYPSAKAALFIAEKAGIPAWSLNVDQTPFFLWRDILDESSRRGVTVKLVGHARDERKGRPEEAYFTAILGGETPVADSEPRGSDGAPRFVSGSDTILEDEARLHHVDLMMFTGAIPQLISTLQEMKRLAPAVCALRVEVPGAKAGGTGFRIGEKHILTNRHVLRPDGAAPLAVVARFGYEHDADDLPIPGVVKRDGLVGTIVVGDDDDWGVIEVPDMDPAWPIIDLASAQVPVVSRAAYILQHPMEGPKRLGFVRNTITHVDTRVLQYLTDTESGSSGSPVFNAMGALVGLHHAGGRPNEVAGKAPVVKNEGVRIERVVAGLKERGVVL